MNQEPEAKPRHDSNVWVYCAALGSFSIGAAVGAAIWWATPQLTGKFEPWHVMYGIPYLVIMFVWGFLLALPVRFNFAFSGPLGLYMGQLIYTTAYYHPGGAIILPLFLSLAFFGMPPTLAGRAIGIGARFALVALKKRYKDVE
jgi:hypothetical protein